LTGTLLLAWLIRSSHAHIASGEDVLMDWHWRWDVISVLVLFGTLYLRGWLQLRKIGGEPEASHLVFYVLALAAIGVALLSPIDELAGYLLIAHMIQHELLMMVAPPLILLARPVPVLLWGLGASSRIKIGDLLTQHSPIRRARDFLGRMPVAWSLYVVNLWAWHHPVFYQAALRDEWIHDTEHMLFFLTALLFWWPIVEPASRVAPVQAGLRILYLFLAATQDTALSGLIALSPTVLYPHYETALRLWDLTPKEDQIGGGIVMFAFGNVAYLTAILVVVYVMLGDGKRKRLPKRTLGYSAEEIEGGI
jgi:putative membrane protein